MKRIYAISVALSAVFLISCGLADVTEDSEFMPSISSKVGCYADSGHVGSYYGCYEFCIREDSTFTFVSDDYTKDSLFEGYGFLYTKEESTLFGTGNDEWIATMWGLDENKINLKPSYPYLHTWHIYPANFSNDYFTVGNWSGSENFDSYRSIYKLTYSSYGELVLPVAKNANLCGQFGALLDTTKYTLDSLAKFAN